MKKIVGAVILIGIMAGSYAYYLYNKPVQSLSNQKADVIISASEFMHSYETDENNANEKYLDKIVEVTGSIREINQEYEQMNVILETDSQLSGIICELVESPKGLKVGETITVKGQCTGYLMDIVLTKCVIIN